MHHFYLPRCRVQVCLSASTVAHPARVFFSQEERAIFEKHFVLKNFLLKDNKFKKMEFHRNGPVPPWGLYHARTVVNFEAHLVCRFESTIEPVFDPLKTTPVPR